VRPPKPIKSDCVPAINLWPRRPKALASRVLDERHADHSCERRRPAFNESAKRIRHPLTASKAGIIISLSSRHQIRHRPRNACRARSLMQTCPSRAVRSFKERRFVSVSRTR
jgi:hypothetical protein